MLTSRPNRNRLITGIDTTVFGIAMIAIVIAVLLMEMSYAPPFDSDNISVQLPQATHSALLRRALREDAITIVVFRDSKILCDNDLIYPEDLATMIVRDLQQGSELKVYLKVDTRAPYRVVKQVLNSVESAGIQNIAFYTH